MKNEETSLFLKSVKSRYDFPILLDAMNAKVGIELGVDRGDFSNHLMENYGGWEMFYGVDEYVERYGATGENKRDEKMYLATLDRFSSRQNYTLMKMTFSAAVEKFPDEFFDFIFIDGNSEDGQSRGGTFYDWWPKLKKGGVFAGRAYDPKYLVNIKCLNKFVYKMDLCKPGTSIPKCIHVIDEDRSKDFVQNWMILKE